jgi:beta-glucosidase
MLGEWSARGRAEDVVTPCAGMERAFGDDEVACVPIEAIDAIRSEELGAALRAASDADAVVVMLGETRQMSGEAASRLYPDIPPAQYRLVEALETLGKPVVAIVFAGRALPVSRLAGRIPGRTASADVVFYTSQLGIEAGNGIADVLSGAHAPSGRLTVSLPCESGIISETFRERRIGRPQETISPMMAAFRDKIGNSGKWVSHLQEVFERDDCPIAFPFGYGLTYTDFAYSGFSLSATDLKASDPKGFVEARVTVTNQGRHAGVAVPQLYLRDTVAVPAPRKLELRGFERLDLQPGESARVTFKITPSDLAIYTIDPDSGRIDPENGQRPQPDEFPVVAFIAEGAEVSKQTPQASFVLSE